MTILSFSTLAPFVLFLALVFGHLLGDYPLQVDFLARAKNHMAPIPGVPWYTALLSHAAIQGGIVALLTGSIALGFAELVAHTIIDYGKSAGWMGAGAEAFNLDQVWHLLCKLAWVGVVIALRRGSL